MIDDLRAAISEVQAVLGPALPPLAPSAGRLFDPDGYVVPDPPE